MNNNFFASLEINLSILLFFSIIKSENYAKHELMAVMCETLYLLLTNVANYISNTLAFLKLQYKIDQLSN